METFGALEIKRSGEYVDEEGANFQCLTYQQEKAMVPPM